MKVKTNFVLLLLITVLAACAPTATVLPPRADNFAFIFQSSPCGPNPEKVLDTAGGTLVYTPLGDTTSTTISLRLTDDQLESIYQKAISIGFFDYPSRFVVPDNQVRGHQMPSSNYQLSMTNGEMTNTVSWQDNTITKPRYTKADQLRELMYLIDGIIRSYPEVQQLPGSKSLCL